VTVGRFARRVLLAAAAVVVAFMAAALVTARPGDPNLYPPAAGTGTVEIFVVNHGYHTGIVLPRAATSDIGERRSLAALIAITSRFATFAFLEIGWGDEGFYRAAPTISAVTVPMALRALFRPGNPSVLHVVGLNESPAVVFGNSELVPIRLSMDGFARMMAMLDASFARSERGELLGDLGPGLYGPSLFFRAVGAFHVFNVCNHWVARLLDAAGVPTSPLLSIAPAGLLLDLRWRSGLRPLQPVREGDAR
jgi:uncharacterized protein (TIGR02117 family)